jgi:hypothetical protein
LRADYGMLIGLYCAKYTISTSKTPTNYRPSATLWSVVT